MLAYPKEGFVFLAMPKCGSSAIETKLARHAAISFTRGSIKHIAMADFERLVVPLIAHAGYPRESYEVVCLFREPVDWLHSWWRYRSRPALADEDNPQHRNYTGHVSFDEFAEAYIARSAPYARVDGDSQAAFVRGADGGVGVDRVFRYEEMEELVAYLERRLGREVRLDRVNNSPPRPMELSDTVRRRLVEHLAPEYEIYRSRAGASTVRPLGSERRAGVGRLLGRALRRG